jgi:tRNA(Ile)-lysidine synthase
MNAIKFPPSGHYVLAVSGGVDSMALMYIMAGLAAEQGWKLRVAHYNHGIRSDSALDQQLVQSAASALGLPFHTTQGNLGAASENTARAARYRFLAELVRQYGADAIITAHHQDDRQETSFYNLSRGSGRIGAAGVRSRAEVLRPLLGVSKAELLEYARANSITWREDSTNTDLTNPRNFLRHELVPLGRSVLPQFDQRLNEALNSLEQLNLQIRQRADEFIVVSEQTASVRYELIVEANEITVADLVLAMAQRLDPNLEMSRPTLVKAAAVARLGRVGSEATINGQLMLRVRRNYIEVCGVDARRQALVAQELLSNGSVRYGEHQLSYGTMHGEAGEHYHVSAGDLKVRTMRPGDRIAPNGLNGTKKLQDLFVDAKIDRSDRSTWPVVVRISDDQVVWVPRLAVSRHFLVSHLDPNAHCLIHEVVTA